jgi:hypothetical protein
MYWECLISVQFDDFPFSDELVCKPPTFSGLRRNKGLHCSISKFGTSPFETVSPANLINIWLKVIQDYTKPSSTVPNDELPAVSAIASWFFGSNVNDYLAGFQKTALHKGLVWRRHMVDGQKHPVPAYRAPSWSWASTAYPVFFTTFKDSRMLRYRTDRRRWQRKFDGMSEKYKIKVHSTNIKLDGSDPFGRLISESIKLRGRTEIDVVRNDSTSY